MKKSRNIPEETKMGKCIHFRLTTSTEKLLKEQAREMKVALATYVRMYVEDRVSKYGLLEYANK